MFQKLQLHLMGQSWSCKSFQAMHPPERHYSTSNLREDSLAYQKSSAWRYEVQKSGLELEVHLYL